MEDQATDRPPLNTAASTCLCLILQSKTWHLMDQWDVKRAAISVSAQEGEKSFPTTKVLLKLEEKTPRGKGVVPLSQDFTVTVQS